MRTSNRSSLAAISSREFQRLAGEPPVAQAATKFRGKRIPLTRFDQHWDRRRGSAVRLACVLLTEDDGALQQRVCENDATVRTYRAAAELLSREAAHLRKVTKMHDTIVARLSAVLERCQSPS